MLRFAIARTQGTARHLVSTVAASRSQIACFSTVSISSAKAVVPGGKKKIRQGYGNKKASDSTKAKPRKGGMTHLKFKDAVRQLGFEKNAASLQLTPLSVESLDPAADAAVVKYSPETLERLSTLNSFKKYQHHELFTEPVSMVTENTRALFKEFVSKSDTPARVCLLGDKGAGKSTLISQVQALSVAKNPQTILIHLDHPEKIVDGTSDYIFNTKLQKYQQPMFTKRWIIRLREANADIFKKLPLSQDITFTTKSKKSKSESEVVLKKGENTVFEFLEQNHDFGKVSPTNAFQLLVEELKHHSKEVPVLVTLDNATGIINEPISKYFHPDYTPIHFKDFEVGSFLLDLMSGDLAFAKGGVLISESSDNRQCHTLDVGLGLQEYDPYYKQDECDFLVANKMLANGGIKSYQLSNLSKDEVRDLMEFWEASGVLQLRDYPRKESPAAIEEEAEEIEEVEEINAEEVFEKSVQNNYTLTSGNVGGLVKVTNFLF